MRRWQAVAAAKGLMVTCFEREENRHSKSIARALSTRKGVIPIEA